MNLHFSNSLDRFPHKPAIDVFGQPKNRKIRFIFYPCNCHTCSSLVAVAKVTMVVGK